MKRRTRSVIKANAVHHIYQNTPNGYLIFYSIKDYLVFYSIVSVMARRYHVQVLGLCLMVDHVHLVVYVRDPDIFRAFVRDYTSLFTVRYNRWYGFQGSLFNTPFGGVPKQGNKKARTAIAYLYNNPVECHLHSRAEAFRWHFLAYAVEQAPFSDKLRLDYARWELRKALRQIKDSAGNGIPLSYDLLERITKDLSAKEIQQLVDYTVRQYAFIDYLAAIQYYESYDKMIMAINSNTGSEYDMQEDTFAKDHRIYSKMITCLCQGTPLTMKDILAFPRERRNYLGGELKIRCRASTRELKKLLRL